MEGELLELLESQLMIRIGCIEERNLVAVTVVRIFQNLTNKTAQEHLRDVRIRPLRLKNVLLIGHDEESTWDVNSQGLKRRLGLREQPSELEPTQELESVNRPETSIAIHDYP